MKKSFTKISKRRASRTSVTRRQGNSARRPGRPRSRSTCRRRRQPSRLQQGAASCSARSAEPGRPASPRALYDDRNQRTLSIIGRAIERYGARKVYCRYDGGNDEGWGWIDHAILADDSRIDGRELAERLRTPELIAQLNAAGLLGGPLSPGLAIDEATRFEHLLDEAAMIWASISLGGGYGTGPYQLYGACLVDMETRTVAEDPDATPIVRNIAFAGD